MGLHLSDKIHHHDNDDEKTGADDEDNDVDESYVEEEHQAIN